jgi:hypothetical protein
MAQTDTRTGFRLPWTPEQNGSHPPAEGPTEEPSAEPVAEMEGGAADPNEENVTADMIDTDAAPSTRRPTKFMADLSRAMQIAAETSRDETMARFASEAKTAVEEIRAASADEAAALRRGADDDVAAVREWSKGEIARIREETEARIAARKGALDGEIEEHAAVIEARVERVGATVSAFETEMAEFFERVLAEQDPTRIATMAEAMPEPPDLAYIAASITEATVTSFEAAPGPLADESASWPDAAAWPATEDAAPATEDATPPDDEANPAVVDMAPAADEASPAVEAETADASELDFAAAEAEAATMTGDLDDDVDTSAALAADADTSLPSEDALPMPVIEERSAKGERLTTRVVVLGLVSVASIATFKRSLGRVQGVSAIGVASGPDGEFVFTVSHDSSLSLKDAIVELAGFDAKITADTADGLEVAAHDPDAGE